MTLLSVTPDLLRRGRLAVLAAGLVLGAGCTHELPMQAVRESIALDVAQQVGLSVERVECPESRPVTVGDRFDCTALTRGGATIAVSVSQIDADGHLRFELGRMEGVLARERLAAEIRAGLAAQAGIAASIDCGSGLDDTPPGAALECTAKDAGGRRAAVRVEVEDRAGAVSWRLADWEPPEAAAAQP